MRLSPSPVIELNHAAALAMVDGPAAALPHVEALAARGSLAGYDVLPAVRADLLRRLGRLDEARAAYEEALRLARHDPERRFFRRRLAEACRPELRAPCSGEGIVLSARARPVRFGDRHDPLRASPPPSRSPCSPPALRRPSRRRRRRAPACMADIQKACPSAKPGPGGGMRECARDHFKEFSQPCQTALMQMRAPHATAGRQFNPAPGRPADSKPRFRSRRLGRRVNLYSVDVMLRRGKGVAREPQSCHDHSL